MVTKVETIPFSQFNVVYYYQLQTRLVEYILTPSKATLLGLEQAYTAYIEAYERLNEIFRRNPRFEETLTIKGNIKLLRDQMALLGTELKTLSRDTGGANYAAASQVNYTAEPYLKSSWKFTYNELLTNAGKLVVDLQTSALTPLVAQLNLTAQVVRIDQLFHETDALWMQRGNEAEFNKQLGTATALRPIIDKSLSFILYVLIPAAIFKATNAEERQAMEEVVTQINALFDEERRKIIPGGGGDTRPGLPGGDDGSDGGSDGNDSGDGDDDGGDDGNGSNGGNGEPPAGGEEPGGGGNGGSDEGSGGPLDRRRLTDRADAAVEVLPHGKTEGNNPIIINIKE